MTIIAAYRFHDDRVIFVSDFRLTEGKRQADVAMKFYPIDERIGLFLSGDVELWKNTIDNQRGMFSQITTDNVLDEDGPLRQGLVGL